MTTRQSYGPLGACLISVVLIGAGASLGCTTLYQAESVKGEGYSDVRLDDDIFKISYKGDKATRPETVDVFLLYRCAELTAQHGYENFLILRTDTGRNHTYDVSHGSDPSNTVFEGNLAVSQGMISPGTVDVQYRNDALIKMFNGSMASVPAFFNAKQVMTHLRLKVFGESEIVRAQSGSASDKARRAAGGS
ncbi:MAG: hypothetical protein ABI856_15040 [Nitrospira sp.]